MRNNPLRGVIGDWGFMMKEKKVEKGVWREAWEEWRKSSFSFLIYLGLCALVAYLWVSLSLFIAHIVDTIWGFVISLF